MLGISTEYFVGLLLALAVLLSACSSATESPLTQPQIIRDSSPAVSTVVPEPMDVPERMVLPLVIDGQSNEFIEGVRVSNPEGDCMRIVGSDDIVIRDAVIGPCGGRAVVIFRSESIRIEESSISDASAGVYALESEGVVITGNVFTKSGRNPIQFDKVSGAGNVVSFNEIHNQEGSPLTEDSISIYSSGGTAATPLIVAGNTIMNGGSSASGSGIMVGDNGGSNILVIDNTLINPGQVGIGVAGGENIRIVGNVVFSRAFPWSNVGIYVWNQYETRCALIEVAGNRVAWDDSGGRPNPRFDAGNCGEVASWEANEWFATIDVAQPDGYYPQSLQ